MALTVVNSDTLVVGPDLKIGVFHLATQPRKSRVCVTVRGVNSENHLITTTFTTRYHY